MVPDQCRRARQLLHWSVADLARAAGISVITVRKFEDRKPGQRRYAIVLMQRAFEGAGVTFDTPSGNDPGVALTVPKPGPAKNS